MKKLRAPIVLVFAALPLFVTPGFAAQPMTWLEHQEAAKAILQYGIADPVTPVQHLEQALDLAGRQGATAADIGALMDQLADARTIYGASQEERERLVIETLRYKEEALGEFAAELVPTLRNLSTIRFHQQENLEALQLMARALTIQVRNFGAESAQAAEGYTFLGLTFESVGDLLQAESLLRRASEIVRKTPNPPDEIYSAVLANVSDFLRRQGHIEESKALQMERTPAMERVNLKNEREAREFEHLPRAPAAPDVRVMTEEEMEAARAAGLLEPAPSPPIP